MLTIVRVIKVTMTGGYYANYSVVINLTMTGGYYAIYSCDY